MHQATRRIVVVASALIPDRDPPNGGERYLVVRARYSGRWISPGGAVEPGENPLDALRRECREELGCAVTVRRLVGVYVPRRSRVLFFAFACAPLDGPVRLSPEHDAARYEPRDRLALDLAAMVDDLRACGRCDVPPAPVMRTTP